MKGKGQQRIKLLNSKIGEREDVSAKFDVFAVLRRCV